MSEKIGAILWGVILLMLVGIVVRDLPRNGEHISANDYRLASLQYLEDIRNSNDAIIQQQEYITSLNCR